MLEFGSRARHAQARLFRRSRRYPAGQATIRPALDPATAPVCGASRNDQRHEEWPPTPGDVWPERNREVETSQIVLHLVHQNVAGIRVDASREIPSSTL